MYNTNKTNNTYFTVDFFNNKIIGTKTSFNKAGKGISPYYQQLTTLIKEHPTFTLAVKEPKKKSRKPKRTYEGLDFKFIEAYISIQKNSARLLMDYNAVKAYAKSANLGVYPITKKWFLLEFDPDGVGFDMAKAREEIIDAGLGDAIYNAEPEVVEMDNVA